MRMVAALDGDHTVHFSRLRVTSIPPEGAGRKQFEPGPMVTAAELLADARVDVIVWNGTSGGMEGLDADRKIVEAIEAATSTPATTGTLATIEAFSELGIGRYGLVVPYTAEITSRVVGTFASAGFECVASTHEGLTANWDFSQVSPSIIADRARSVSRAQPQGIAIFCTNLCGAPVVDLLEGELGVPVVDSVIVCLWAAFHVLGRKPALKGWGRLMARY